MRQPLPDKISIYLFAAAAFITAATVTATAIVARTVATRAVCAVAILACTVCAGTSICFSFSSMAGICCGSNAYRK